MSGFFLTQCLRGKSAIALTIWLGAVGCVTVPPPPSKDSAATESVAAHIRFLSQPVLKGRKTGSHGASLARRYIEERFRACGLIPWPGEKNFELPFGLGCNVVGLLPGSDTNLAGEIVILSAHYDHLGKDSHGRICPGASDNATGVAVLLEAARQLSQPGAHPRRSVAFAAFDSEEEMLFGSFAFTCRPDVAEAKIAAVINLDMLGRNFLDVVTNTIFLVGTEAYPDLRESICQTGARAGLRLLPVGSDLIGPRSDHVAFESRGVPSLFLSSGIHRDYHRYTDTADKLDYAELDRSVALVVDSVQMLADRPIIPAPAHGDGDREELRTLCTVLSEVRAQSDRAGIKPQDAAAFAELEHRAEGLLAGGNYDSRQRVELISGASGTLVPYLLPIELGQGDLHPEQRQDMLNGVQFLQGYYLSYRAELLEAYHQLVAHILKYRPGAFRRLPPFRYEIGGLHEQDILFTNLGNGQFALRALIMPMVLSAESRSWLGVIQLPSISLAGFWSGLEETGTRDQLSDLCLLRLRASQQDPARAGNYLRLFQVVSGAATNAGCNQLIQQQWRQEQCQDETEWIARLMLSGRSELAFEAMNAAAPDKTGRIRQTACTLITDRSVRSDVRARAMELAMKDRDRTVLLALCTVLDDPSPAMRKEYSPLFDPASPFADQPLVKSMRAMTEHVALAVHPYAKKSLGDVARDHLKKAAGRDLGQDPEVWRQWVERQRR
jgi:hypothetical protein